MRRVFIGDIQGCRKQLDALLRVLRLRSDDCLYCAGDMVNRGPDSLGVLRRLRDLDARPVLGNHDLHLLRLAAGTADTAPSKLLRPVLDAPDADELLDWLGRQPILRVEDDLVLVHAGIHPTWNNLPGVARAINSRVRGHVRHRRDPRIRFATTVRHCDARGRQPPHDDPPPGKPFRPWDYFYEGPRIAVFGHWARRGLVHEGHVRGLDTGCVYGGQLTAWIAGEDRFVDVPGWHG